jgi:hypothetical protein
MSDHEARARKLTFYRDLQREIALLRKVEREALERAAQVADNYARDGRTHKELACETADEIAARIRSLAVKEGAAQWQDISTAPKDGSKILAWDGDYVIVRADPNGGWSDDFEQYLRLDKWMPLPAPPAVKEGEGV